MKSLLILFVICSGIACSQGQTVEIAGNTFYPAYTNSSAKAFLKEYLLRGETTKNWTKLFAVRQIKNVDSPKDYIYQMADEYHKKLPWMKFAVGEQKSTGRWFIDFIMYERGKPKNMEWNCFRAETNSAGGILVYQYAERRKGKEAESWDIKGLRKQMVPLVLTNEFSLK